ncbi:hypothetical protein SELR_19800 [Selenomonas ruminantium subsp. lactilytica TAM6421]|uniref:DUF3006 domain-containing protein n=1 Tax=Selenomonas ruminantium subsp. lactilytica (strain NBRC 103574 / TAM6421) TaxID=927704 RepID=I0GSF1_SELRL|nr:DUF3006 domain-containing protein [Selenomonas ruminantium]BAL83688.1 hypothetical protein SELR_19800 [Selenomonas ruminantium subsp. lactilytica TAM6421]
MISAYIDRYEGNLAVLLLGEEMKKVNFPREFLPEDVDEGDYIKIDIALDKEANDAAEQEALELLRD